MKTVLYTQRVDFIEEYGERRDCADQRIPRFLASCGYLPMPVPNVPELLKNSLGEILPEGIFFTGGNSLMKYGGDAPERDEAERIMVEWGIAHKIPIFGICRGMQFLADFLGGIIHPISGHAGTRHAVEGRISRAFVNSYHTLALWEGPDEIEVLARAQDGSIEAFCHRSHAVMAISWHPEREEYFSKEDLKMVRDFFG